MQSFLSMIEEVKALVKEEIQKGNRPDYVLDMQLSLILGELDKMEQVKNIHVFNPYYPSAIIDSWDFSDPLAIKLMKLLEMYRKL